LLLPLPVAAQIRFEEIGEAAGLSFQLRNGASGRYSQVELMPGGVAAFDFDNDGCTDLFFTNGAELPSLRKASRQFHNRLYRNNCDLHFTDVTASAGLTGEGYSMGVAAGDYDNDGFVDLYVAGVNRNILYRNLGNGRFEDVTERSLTSGVHPKLGKLWGMSPGWFDYDNDGDLDLFVVNYLAWDPRHEPRCGLPSHRLYCHPDNYRGVPNQLLRNNGDGTFSDVSNESGIGAEIGKGMGVAFADFDRDGHMDVMVANDSLRGFLFHNQGDGTFKESGLEAGVALRDDGTAIAGMGVDFRDADEDGWPDVLITGMINDSYLLFRNLGQKLMFEDSSIRSGLALATRQLTGWGTGIYDFDADGHKDLFFANSHFPQLDRYIGTSTSLPDSVFRNRGNGTYENVSRTAGLQAIFGHSRGTAFADFDNDGRVGVVVTALNGPVRLWRNVTDDYGKWLALALRGTRSNRDGIGARVSVSLSDGRTLHNHVTTSVGYASSSEPVVRFGIGTADVKKVVIQWPSGAIQEVEGVEPGRITKITEPDQT
ncbi:MAG: CRTAC1 family protein, partial [Bryobacteraceae bacterium]